jgi:hypothetical protein
VTAKGEDGSLLEDVCLVTGDFEDGSFFTEDCEVSSLLLGDC